MIPLNKLLNYRQIRIAFNTIGAGDSFNVAFVCHFLQKGDAVKNADVANRLSFLWLLSEEQFPFILKK